MPQTFLRCFFCLYGGRVPLEDRHLTFNASVLIFLAEKPERRNGMDGIENGELELLRKKLASKRTRVLLRYGYYEMKNRIKELKGLIPDDLKWLSYSLGWCAKAVDTLADRIVFDRFTNDSFSIDQIYRLNNADILFSSAVLSALISSCSFIYIGAGDDGYPFLQVVDGSNATGRIDSSTNMLTEGYAVLERDDYGRPVMEALFLPNMTMYYENGRLRDDLTLYHKAPYALLVPIIYRPDARRPFGHSRISRSCMDITQAVVRTIKRSEVSAEFYSIPQKYILGLSNNIEFNGHEASLKEFVSFGKDENGDKPSVGQFQQQSMAPFTEQFKMFASIFAGETDLTLDDLGVPTANPSSYEAIKASHEALKLTARKAQRTFGTGFINAGCLAACLRDGIAYDRRAFVDTKPTWLPIFEPDASTLGALGDAIYKIDQALPGFVGAETLRQLTGLEGES